MDTWVTVSAISSSFSISYPCPFLFPDLGFPPDVAELDAAVGPDDDHTVVRVVRAREGPAQLLVPEGVPLLAVGREHRSSWTCRYGPMFVGSVMPQVVHLRVVLNLTTLRASETTTTGRSIVPPHCGSTRRRFAVCRNDCKPR